MPSSTMACHGPGLKAKPAHFSVDCPSKGNHREGQAQYKKLIRARPSYKNVYFIVCFTLSHW